MVKYIQDLCTSNKLYFNILHQWDQVRVDIVINRNTKMRYSYIAEGGRVNIIMKVSICQGRRIECILLSSWLT